MPKQYTFKTTRATQWLESELDGMPPSERSRFIREAIIQRLGQSDVTRQTSDKVIRNTSDVTQSQTDEIVFKEKDIDLEGVLNNMFE